MIETVMQMLVIGFLYPAENRKPYVLFVFNTSIESR